MALRPFVDAFCEFVLLSRTRHPVVYFRLLDLRDYSGGMYGEIS